MKPENILEIIKKYFKGKTVISNLILVNIVVFLFIQAIHIIAYFFVLNDWIVVSGEERILHLTWFYLASVSDIGEFVYRPWSLITYMFTHEGLLHLASNMLILFYFGKYLYTYLGGRKFLSTYVLGGIAGWILYALAYNFLPVLANSHGPMWGASAAVMATVVAAATYAPNLKIRIFAFQLEFKYLAMILVVIDFLALKSGVNTGGHIGHLGGAIYGYFMIKQLQKGKDLNAWLERLIDRLLSFGTGSPKMKVVYNKNKAAEQSDAEYNQDKAKAQKKVDLILDKISHGGYDSLTKAEKAFLNKYSAK